MTPYLYTPCSHIYLFKLYLCTLQWLQMIASLLICHTICSPLHVRFPIVSPLQIHTTCFLLVLVCILETAETSTAIANTQIVMSVWQDPSVIVVHSGLLSPTHVGCNNVRESVTCNYMYICSLGDPCTSWGKRILEASNHNSTGLKE